MADSLHRAELDFVPVPKTNGPRRAPPAGQLPVSATVLLVEDDAIVRECLRELLDDVGGRVVDAADAAEALERMAAEGVPDVLVTDLQLGPGMNGLGLIAAARQQWPGVRAVLISGTDVAEPPLEPGDRFLRKPFDVSTLAQAIAEMAGGQARP